MKDDPDDQQDLREMRAQPVVFRAAGPPVRLLLQLVAVDAVAGLGLLVVVAAVAGPAELSAHALFPPACGPALHVSGPA